MYPIFTKPNTSNILKTLKTLLAHFYADSLYRNSIYLMASTGVMAAFGFVFWIINARFYTSEQIGLATTLISVTSLIVGFSMLGLNTALIRFLPTSERKNDKINTGFTLVILATIVLSVGFIVGLPIFSPKLMFLRQKPAFELLFILFIVFSSLNAILDSIFIAYRSSVYVFVKNTVWSALKLALPLFAISLGAWGIYASVSVATIIAVVMSVFILIQKFQYKPNFKINKEIVTSMAKYSGGNYLAGLLGGLPTMLLPLIITNKLGPQMAAYYYMPMMITNLLYIIPQATTRSFFAEGSHNKQDLKKIYLRALKINALLLFPAMMLVYFFGKYVLMLFGNEYAFEGTRILQLLSISSIFLNISSINNVFITLRKEVIKLIIMNLISLIILLVNITWFIRLGLYGVGIALFIYHVTNSILSVYFSGILSNPTPKNYL